MRRRLIVGGCVLILIAAGAVTVLRNGQEAPLPSENELRTSGFAVWPEDTVEEGVEACEDAEAWRLDPQEAAFQFAREVLRYPEPALNTHPIGDEEGPRNQVRYLVDSGGLRGVFLGSVIDVKKYGRCWYVIHLEPREEGFLPPIAYAHRGDDTQLVLNTNGVDTQIGYGTWERNVTAKEDQVVLDLPDLPRDATGHLMSLGSYQQVRGGSAARLGFVPDPATVPTRHLEMDDIVTAPGICRRDAVYRHPGPALYALFNFTFDSGIDGMRGRRVQFLPGFGARRIGPDRWVLDVGRARLQARISRLKSGCWRVLSFSDGGSRILRSLHVEPDRLTLELDWTDATSATFTVSTSRGVSSSTFDKFSGPLTVRTFGTGFLDEPLEVNVVLRDGRRILSAERTWRAPSR